MNQCHQPLNPQVRQLYQLSSGFQCMPASNRTPFPSFTSHKSEIFPVKVLQFNSLLLTGKILKSHNAAFDIILHTLASDYFQNLLISSLSHLPHSPKALSLDPQAYFLLTLGLLTCFHFGKSYCMTDHLLHISHCFFFLPGNIIFYHLSFSSDISSSRKAFSP